MTIITGAVSNVVSAYGRQQFYADRTAKIKALSGPQIGVKDSVTISKEAVLRQAASNVTPSVKSLRSGPTTYDDPRKFVQAKKLETQKRRESDKPAELKPTDQIAGTTL